MLIVRWLGQACFLLTTLAGSHILIDPPHPEVGYHIAAHSIPANVVFVSHEHPDHNYVEAAAAVGGTPPRVIQPLPLSQGNMHENGTYSFARSGAEADKFTFERISAYHDNNGGSQRGPDTITVLQTGGLRVCHLGDLGQLALTPAQIKAIGHVDVLMIPVGGFFTIDGPQAAVIVRQIHPRVILPMHYRTPALNPDLRTKLAPPDSFLTAMQGHAKVVHVSARDLRLSPKTLPKTPTIYLLRYE